jgi:hypothetical protein
MVKATKNQRAERELLEQASLGIAVGKGQASLREEVGTLPGVWSAAENFVIPRTICVPGCRVKTRK